MRPATGRSIAAPAVGALLAITWSWWAIKQGAYFGVVLYPGLGLLTAGLLLMLLGAPWKADLSLSRPTRLALFSLFGLAAWSALSAFWSPTPDVAVADAQRIAGYGLCFALGIWFCNVLGPRMHLALAPLAIAGAVAGAVTVGVMLLGHDLQTYLDGDGTLQYPLGYRNANAAFFAIAVWPALTLAQTRSLAAPLRAAALVTSTLCLEIAMLCQSRGSVPAVVVALAVYLVVAPDRLRAFVWLMLAALPAIVVIPALNDLYSATLANGIGAVQDQLRAAGRAVVGGCALALAAGTVALVLERRIQISPARGRTLNRLLTGGLLTGVVLAVVGFVVATGNPADWIGQRVHEFRSGGTPDLTGESNRFTANAGSDRVDLWRVALDDAGADPLFGDGGGGYQYSYTQNRTVTEQNVRDAHSVEFEVLSELGIPGLALLAMAVAGATTAAIRARRLGPTAATLSLAALSAGAYWLVHGSVDWLWAYPAVTAPTFALMGSACAPGLLAPASPGRWRPWVAVAAIGLALTLVPPYLSERYTDNAYSSWRSDPEKAFSDLDRARQLNPLANEPSLAEGAIARQLGDDARSVEAFERAVDHQPEDWAAHYFLARAYGRDEPALARRELDLALELNPLSGRLRALDASFGAKDKPAE